MDGRMIELNLRGKRALITGGSRGVGRATALMLAKAGAQVGISYNTRHDDARALVTEIERQGVQAFAQPGDISDPVEVERLFGRVLDEFGGLDIFIANAGIWPPDNTPIALMHDEQWRRTLQINLDSVFFTTRAAARIMFDGGKIVFVSSTAGQRGEAGHVDYAASKGAMISMVKGLALEMALHQININCVAPGWIDTEMTEIPYAGDGRRRIEAGIPLGRVASADDIAGPIVFLCSDLARHITGEIMNINGGSVLCG
jgi:3-oxoacyl-[acyl-carrier protein] reductase